MVSRSPARRDGSAEPMGGAGVALGTRHDPGASSSIHRPAHQTIKSPGRQGQARRALAGAEGWFAGVGARPRDACRRRRIRDRPGLSRDQAPPVRLCRSGCDIVGQGRDHGRPPCVGPATCRVVAVGGSGRDVSCTASHAAASGSRQASARRGWRAGAALCRRHRWSPPTLSGRQRPVGGGAAGWRAGRPVRDGDRGSGRRVPPDDPFGPTAADGSRQSVCRYGCRNRAPRGGAWRRRASLGAVSALSESWSTGHPSSRTLHLLSL
jgi:hypothetical protein